MASKHFFLVQFMMIISILQTTASSNTTDLTALLDFKNRITEDPLGIMLSWNDSDHHCNWRGITCDPSNKRVQTLNLTSQKLVGTLPPSLGNLSFLTGINLILNSFNGEIPSQIGLLSNLKHLRLARNMLSGSIPPNLGNCTELTVLNLVYNQLSGEIPNQLSSLTKLEIFGVGVNKFMTSTFPVWIGNLSSRFSQLSLAVNRFHGGIPPEIGRLSGLTFFEVSGNMLSGSIPPNLGNCTELTVLNLEYNQLSGEIPSQLSSLTKLEIFGVGGNKFMIGTFPVWIGNLSSRFSQLSLAINRFHGGIPPEIGRLSGLTFFQVSRNMLSGSIPPNLGNCTELTHLTFEYNNLSGEIPSQLSALTKLERFNVAGNNYMTGTFPIWVGNLSLRFSHISLASNRFHGVIPPEIGRLSGLTFFDVSDNEFSGELPPSFYNLSSLSVFSVAHNRLHGTISRDIGSRFPNLEFFSCGANNFTGEIPISFANASRLTLIDLGNNNLRGSVPSNLGNLPFVHRINLHSNLLGNGETADMNFISSLTNCTNLRFLALAANRFGGELPTAVTNLSRKLELISLGGNQMHGSIPLGFGSFENLTTLNLQSNHFSGTIPTDIGNLRKLNKLDLRGNLITGEIPSSLGNLTSLIELYLDSNKLHGSIPPHLGNCTRLLQLNISSNNLTGNIPKKVMSLSSLSILLGLARNAFSGPLPNEVGLFNLKELDVSGNKLSGPIPSSLSSCLSLEMLRMGGNKFEGPIPEALEALRGLEVIDFSHNNLSGKIPEFLGTKLPFIKKLDLSYNNLEGEVLNDGIFTNATAISVVGNEHLCGGAASLNLTPCLVPARKSDKNHKLRLIIAVSVSSLVLFLLICSLTLFYILRKPKKKDDPTPSSTKEMEQISYLEIYRSTNGFSAENLIGSGSFGWVYKGILGENRASMAIKVLNLEQKGASKSFVDECTILKSVRHRNLLKIITVCSGFDRLGKDFKCLITEFMINGSLDSWLHHRPSRDSSGAKTLDIMQRLNIAIDVASALDYLHNHSHAPIIHCDLKPSNVLLDEDLTAHVADFGLAKVLLQPLQGQSVSVELRGSIGYIPPEYGTSTQISSLGDVYSYGILLLELFTGKRPMEEMFNDGLSIHEYVAMALSGRVAEVLDPSLNMAAGEAAGEVHGGEWQPRYSREMECLGSVLKIGVSCSVASPVDRTPINVVVQQLNAIRVRIGRAN